MKKAVKLQKTDISIVLICYNMQREIIRTIQSFLKPYQIGVNNKKIEIIVIDNGSDIVPDLSQFQDKIKFIQFQSKHPSPVEAINHGIKIASSDLIGVLIDGARMVTPGMCRDVIKVNDIHDRVIVSTLAFHLGPEVQMKSVFKGYDQKLEDKLLDEIDWINNGYDLYLTSSLAQSSINGLYGSIAESNAIFANKKVWEELGGYDERFISLGGGLSNLDLYKRSYELENLSQVRLTSEATFHQVHGGVATNNKIGTHRSLFNNEYQSIHGKPYTNSQKIPELYGEMLPQVEYFFTKNQMKDKYKPFKLKQLRLNSIISKDAEISLFNINF